MASSAIEPILEPDLPIIDPHHHLWDWPAALLAARPAPEHGFTTVVRRAMRYLLPELLSDLNSGHNIRATVFVQCGAMYRADGPEGLKPVGETEFVNGVAAMCASGTYGSVRACAGIVGHVDLTAGAEASEVLEAHFRRRVIAFAAFVTAPLTTRIPRYSGPLVRVGPGLFAQKKFPRGLRATGQVQFIVRCVAPGTSIARINRSGASLSRHAGHYRSCRHAAGDCRLSRQARGAVSDLARQHAKACGAPQRIHQAWRPGDGVLQFSILSAIPRRRPRRSSPASGDPTSKLASSCSA